MKHLLDNANSSDSEAPPPAKKAELKALEAILDDFGPVTNVTFEPFICESPQPAKAILPLEFPSTSTAEPYDYFTLFFTPTLLKIISSNTNQYANLQRMRVKQERARQWYDLVIEELFVFIGALIYMGIYEEPRIDMYLNQNKRKGPIHTISTHITLNRYEDIKRYWHIL